MNVQLVLFIVTTSGIALAGFVAGLFYARYHAAPWTMITLLFLAEFVLLIVAGAWAASCSRCTSFVSEDNARFADFYVSFFYGGLYVTVVSAITLLGAWVSVVVRDSLPRKRA